MRVINHDWSATKQRLHPQSLAEISRHSVLSGDRIRQCETSSGSRHKDTVPKIYAYLFAILQQEAPVNNIKSMTPLLRLLSFSLKCLNLPKLYYTPGNTFLYSNLLHTLYSLTRI